MDSYEEVVRDHLLEKVKEINATLVGKPFSISDEKEREEFVDWYREMADRLGVQIKVKQTYV